MLGLYFDRGAFRLLIRKQKKAKSIDYWLIKMYILFTQSITSAAPALGFVVYLFLELRLFARAFVQDFSKFSYLHFYYVIKTNLLIQLHTTTPFSA